MTLKALQEYLDVAKWKDSEKFHADMCGRYARCRYCTRTEEYPCARAHNRLAEMQASPVPDRIPEWLLPEPPVPAAVQQPKRAPAPKAEEDGAPVAELTAESAEAPAAEAEAQRLAERVRPHVIARTAKNEAERTRILSLHKKPAAPAAPQGDDQQK